MHELEVNEIIEKFAKIIGPVAFTIASESAKEVGVEVIGGKVEFIENEEQYASLLEKFKEKLGRIVGNVLADALITG